ncbi:hypothetical protein HKX42_07185 [Salinisphaera sp. USBA-960]|uniref:hypothetical protein n=1 Tax=Salinisphaera orenii TaxID=856731 RepID=UPI000DBEA7F5|nr:hypothetical protein [Salifodinibacter halophilus]NNC26656.1 hypothetical protein [Salifodinibacter halophilus]
MDVVRLLTDAGTRFTRVRRTARNSVRVALDSQRQAAGIVLHNGRTLINTEIGAAKNLSAALGASVRRARGAGLRRVASQPADYLPNGRRQVIAAAKDSAGVIQRTGDELNQTFQKALSDLFEIDDAGESGDDQSTSSARTTADPDHKTSPAGSHQGRTTSADTSSTPAGADAEATEQKGQRSSTGASGTTGNARTSRSRSTGGGAKSASTGSSKSRASTGSSTGSGNSKASGTAQSKQSNASKRKAGADAAAEKTNTGQAAPKSQSTKATGGTSGNKTGAQKSRASRNRRTSERSDSSGSGQTGATDTTGRSEESDNGSS